MNEMFGIAGGLIMLILIIFIVIVLILWIFVPFIILGTNKRLDKIDDHLRVLRNNMYSLLLITDKENMLNLRSTKGDSAEGK
jgi:hypothetical protein